MSMVEVQIRPEILKWVKNTILRQRPLTEKQQENLSLLTAWIQQEKKPTLAKVEKLSADTKIPFGYFFLQHPPKQETALADYRTIKSKGIEEPSRELVDIVNRMLLIQDWMADDRRENGFDALPYVGSMKGNKKAEMIAAAIRKELGLSKDWYLNVKATGDAAFRFLRKYAMQANIIVMQSRSADVAGRRPLNIQEFRALTLVHPFAPLIFINANDSSGGKLFSLAHELAHVWIGQDSLLNVGSEYISISPLETCCNAVAAELLMPRSCFLVKWKNIFLKMDANIEQTAKELARYFRCGRIPVLRRAMDTGFITREIYEKMVGRLLKQYKESEHKAKKKEGGDYYTIQASRWDARFLQALEVSTKSGRTSYVDAYRLTGTTGKTFPKLMEKVRGMIV